MSSLKQIQMNHLRDLQALLEPYESIDPFASSAGYFGMTGRNGLWISDRKGYFFIIATHPNDSRETLIFPPYGEAQFSSALDELLDDPFFENRSIQLARVPESISPEDFRLKNYEVDSFEESILDWNFPVHQVCVKTLCQLEGKKFSKFRNHLKNAMSRGTTTREIHFSQDEEHLIQLVSRWAKDGKKELFTLQDLVDPTLSLIKIAKKGSLLNIGGVITYDSNSRPLGFWIWELVDDCAMSLARVSIGHMLGIRGTAEFTAHSMAMILDQKGVSKICLGGSETESLNKFKVKLVPKVSANLTSFRVVKNIRHLDRRVFH